MSTGLWAHQSLALARAKELRDLALFMEPGTGKTRTAIEVLRHQYNEAKRVSRTLIMGPLIVCDQWKREFAKFSKVDPDKILVLTGAGDKRLKRFMAQVEKYPSGFIAVMNYEGLLMSKLYPELVKWAPEILILDESHLVKDPSAKRSKLMVPLADGAKHRYILTGTPVLNSPLDLFQQFRCLDKGETFGKNFYQFRAQYFWDRNAGMPRHKYFPDWVARADAAEKLQGILSTRAVQAKKEECLDLPPFVQVDIPVGMGPEQAKAYEEMEKHFITLVSDQAVTAQLAITQSIRLQQILAGFVQPEKGEPVFFERNPRLTALVEKCASLVPSGKVIIWTHFAPTYKQIDRALAAEGIKCIHLTGQQSHAEKEENIRQFAQGPIPVAIANAQAVGIGVNLVESKYAIHYSRTHSMGRDEQATARNYRGGSEMHDKITRYDLFVPETLDALIMECLKNKKSVADEILAWARK